MVKRAAFQFVFTYFCYYRGSPTDDNDDHGVHHANLDGKTKEKEP